MLLFTVEELERHGVPYSQKSQFFFQGRQFTKTVSFSQRIRQNAIDLYRSYLNAGVFCLLVETPEYLTICRQK